MAYRSGRHFLQIPGPTNVPDRVLRAMDLPTMDHRGPDFAHLGKDVLAGMQRVFRTESRVAIFPSSGTGAWEAALVNTLSPGDRVLMCETGHFATLWQEMATRLGLTVDFLPGDWRSGADPARVAERPARGLGARDQGARRGAQRDLHRRDQPHPRAAPRPGRDRAPCPAPGRHDLLARLHRLPSRRVGRGRDGLGLAEGPDAAAGTRLQRHQREGPGRGRARRAAALVLGLAIDAGTERVGLLPLHAGHEPALRAA